VSVKTTESSTAVMPCPTVPVGGGPGAGAEAGAAAAVVFVIVIEVPGDEDVLAGEAAPEGEVVSAGAEDAGALPLDEFPVTGAVPASPPSVADVPGGGVDKRSPTTSAAER